MNFPQSPSKLFQFQNPLKALRYLGNSGFAFLASKILPVNPKMAKYGPIQADFLQDWDELFYRLHSTFA